MTTTARLLVLAFLAGIAAFASAQEGEPLALTRRLADAGGHQLVLDRVARLQPADRRTAGWSEWEGLRCRALEALGRHAELADRLDRLTAGGERGALAPCFVSGARASFALKRYAAARRYAADALWQPKLPLPDVQSLRRLVIDAYAHEGRGDDAYRAMLRYQQDYAPLARDVAGQFVSALLDLKMDKEALTWLPLLDDAQAAKLALRLRAGLVTPDAAVAQARAALAKGGDAAYWSILVEAARRTGQWPVLITAYEQLLNRRATDVETGARRLWDAYLAAAVDTANRARLLVGDDANWSDVAGRRLGSDPAIARALFAHLTRQGQSALTRQNAQLQLLQSYRDDRLELAALRVFDTAFPDVDAIDTQVRYRLGAIAQAGDAAAALRYWRDLPAPPDTGDVEWGLRLARMRLRIGEEDIGLDGLTRRFAANNRLSASAVDSAVRFADELNEAGRYAAARALLQTVLTRVPATAARAANTALARAEEGGGEYALAAEAYLRSVLLAPAVADAAAVEARWRAGVALAKARYLRDARAQFEWVVTHSKDAAMADAARRELSRLQP